MQPERRMQAEEMRIISGFFNAAPFGLGRDISLPGVESIPKAIRERNTAWG
jgi:hypothetical protein